jgi:dihydropteroate synthase
LRQGLAPTPPDIGKGIVPAQPVDIDRLARAASGRTLVMGVVNTTPDSFSDGGDFLAADVAIAHGRRLLDEGVDIVDVGGESTRPGAAEVDAATELARVMPVVDALVAAGGLVSIDTYKAAVAEKALAAGARIVNDVYGLQRDPEIARVAGHHGAAVIASHWERGSRGDGDLLDSMRRYFDRAVALARAAGIPDRRIVLDPGIGFGKELADNLVILNRFGEIAALGFPVLIGVSRKRFIGNLTGRVPKERLAGTIAANVLAVAAGAAIVRVHDVAAHRDALAVADAILAGRAP